MPVSEKSRLAQRRAEIVNVSQDAIKAARDEDRDLTSAERAMLDANAAEVKRIDEDLAREEEVRRQAGASGRVQLIHNRAEDEPWGNRTGAALGEQLQAIHAFYTRNERDPRLFASLGATEDNASAAGFLVGTDHINEVSQRIMTGEVLSRVRVLPVSSGANGVNITVSKENSRATGSRFGGVQGYWRSQGSGVTASMIGLDQLHIGLEDLMAVGYATDEQIQDAPLLEALVFQAFTEELRFQAEDAIIEGTGAGMPKGLLNSLSGLPVISVAKETGQAAATLLYENLLKMWSRMWSRSWANAVWFINQDTTPQLDLLVQEVGTGGIPPNFIGYNQAGVMTIKGRPVIPIEYCPPLGTQGDVILADMSQYGIVRKGNLRLDQSMHVAFLTGEQTFRATYRIGGMPLWRSELTPFKGTATQSPFVVLDTRA